MTEVQKACLRTLKILRETMIEEVGMDSPSWARIELSIMDAEWSVAQLTDEELIDE